LAGAFENRLRSHGFRAFPLLEQARHVALPVVGTLGILALLVVTGAAREVGSLGMVGAGDSAVADPVAIEIAITLEAPETLEVFLGEHLAAIDRLFRILEWVAHPVVHAEVEVGVDE